MLDCVIDIIGFAHTSQPTRLCGQWRAGLRRIPGMCRGVGARCGREACPKMGAMQVTMIDENKLRRKR